MAETRVDLLHLLEDLRDAYPGAVEETILTEILANALDSGAGSIRLTADPANASLTIVDDGAGMPRRDLRRYHDLATSSKTRGQGIGFAGVGIKLALLACKAVVTETRRGASHVATQWHLSARHKAPWKWVPPPGMLAAQGTAVRLLLADPLSPLTDRGYLEAAVRRHYEPLLDPAFDGILAAMYPRGIAFEVNGETLRKQGCAAPETAPLAIVFGRKRKPAAIGYLFREAAAVSEDRRGIAISTYGKIIKRGWDWLGVSANAPERIGGSIEVPALAASLTLNKGDFIRTGPRGAAYLAYRKAIQEAVVRQLAAWGDSREQPAPARPRSLRVLERDLERVLLDLSKGFPLLAALVEHRRGGQKALPLGPKAEATGEPGLGAVLHAVAEAGCDAHGVEPDAQPGTGPQDQPPREPQDETRTTTPDDPLTTDPVQPEPRRQRRPSRLGLAVQFEERPGDPELGRLVESTVLINTAHPAFRRAAASRSEGYHVALSVALALAPLAAEPAAEHGFVVAFLSRWGEAVAKAPAPRKKS